MVALSDFPSFTSSTQLFKALRSQGFVVERRGPGYRVTNAVTGQLVFIHSGSITDRSGARSKNILKELVGIGFLPPAEYERNEKRLALSARHIAEAEEVEREPQEPTEAPVDTDPNRAFPCPMCAEQRCRICIKKELPCAFRYQMGLGRHTTSVHEGRRSSKVRTRIDTEVIPNLINRRIAGLKRMQAEMVLLLDDLFEDAEKLRKENEELRSFKRDVERTAGALYDATTKPRS